MRKKLIFIFTSAILISLFFFACKKEKAAPTVASSNFSCETRPIINARLVPVGSLSKGRTDLIAGAANNKILFAGGQAQNDPGVDPVLVPSRRVDIYDISTNSWSTAELREGGPSWDLTVASVGDKILFAGGRTFEVTKTVDIYNASTNTWTNAELSERRTNMGAATLGSKVFFAGGWSGISDNGYSSRIDIYDDAANSWSIATLSEARSGISAVNTNDKIFFAGGSTTDLFDDYEFSLNTIDVFEEATNTWSTSHMEVPRYSMASIAVGNKIFWAGGFNSNFPPSLPGYAEIRDINSGASSLACMIPRSGLRGVTKDDNIIFFTGYGADERNGTHFEIYNTTTDTWSTGVLNQKIQGAAIIAVNNTIYVAGGWDGAAQDFFTQVWKLEF